MSLVADGIQAPNSTATVNVTLRSQEQLLLPNLVQWMRQRGAAGLELGNATVRRRPVPYGPRW